MSYDPRVFLPGAWALIVFLYLVVLSGPKLPPSEGYRVPVYYGSPAPLSFAGDFRAPPYPDNDPDDHDPNAPAPALSYEERFSDDALGDWAWADATCLGCTVSQAAVREQGVGE